MITYREKTYKREIKHIEILKSELDGYIHNIDAFIVGEVTHGLGAGRTNVNDQIDHSVGILFHKKYGDKVSTYDPILEIHTKSKEDALLARKNYLQQ